MSKKYFDLTVEIEGRASVVIEAESEEAAREQFEKWEGVVDEQLLEWSPTGKIISIEET